MNQREQLRKELFELREALGLDDRENMSFETKEDYEKYLIDRVNKRDERAGLIIKTADLFEKKYSSSEDRVVHGIVQHFKALKQEVSHILELGPEYGIQILFFPKGSKTGDPDLLQKMITQLS